LFNGDWANIEELNLGLLKMSSNELTTLPSGTFSQLVKAECIVLTKNHFKEE